MTQLQCKDRIKKELEGRIKDFQTALKKSEDGSFTIDGDDYEDFISWINSYALAYAEDPHYRAMRLELSYGGPQDYFLFFDDGIIEYHFLDWFDGAEIILSGKDYEVMEKVKDYLTC